MGAPEVYVGSIFGVLSPAPVDVITLSVEDDPTYIAGGVIVHNCPLVCGPRDGKRYDLETLDPIGHNLKWEGGPGAIHFGCRCVASLRAKPLPGMESYEPSTRAAEGGTVAGTVTFADWLSRRSPEQIEEQLGKHRADLFLSGKLTLSNLLDMKGNPLSVKQLEARYGRAG